MRYRWEAESSLEIAERRPAKRFLIQTLGGLFPVMQKLHDGTIACVGRGGDFHVGERGYLTYATSDDGGESWSFARPLGPYGPDDRGPAFIQTAAGTLLISFQNGPFYDKGKYVTMLQRTKGVVRLIRSVDLGANWDYLGALPGDYDPSIIEGGLPFGKMSQLADGTILLPIYAGRAESAASLSSYIFRSRDDGKTWGDPTRIGEGFNETQLLPLPSGKLIAMLRRNNPEPQNGPNLWQADSTDGGYTWSEPRRITDYDEHPADIIRLADGRLLLTYGYRKPPFGVRAIVSNDDGATWNRRQIVTLVNELRSRDCGYPSSVQRDDGTILTAYYIVESHGPFAHGVMRTQIVNEHAALVAYRPEDLP